MYVSGLPILLTLGGKCLLNWVAVFLQKRQICRSFLGVFSVSLAVVDMALTFSFTKVYFHGDELVIVFGHLMTKYDVCLLVQLAGHISRVLQWPVVLMASVDHLCSGTRRLEAISSRPAWVIHSSATVLLWLLTALYLLLQYDFVPDISKRDVLRCRVFHSLQVLHITLLLLLVLACTALFSLIRPFPKSQITNQRQTPCRRSFVQQTLQDFHHTWTPFLVFLAGLPFLPVGIPSYLDLNVVWLHFLNSLLVAIVLCAVCPFSQVLQDLPELS
ncbi:probable G-protein coupled receptor 160 [Kryptolebias marmoratus]|uniref:probable G-protein coupled receptor 160 n=1 Tax=Kryptolebias marmoratus TaxID=37003 RepID=UPI0007F89319|nr:probable G-protein coupled receptor 160 [Kryptolebias marmoratus]